MKKKTEQNELEERFNITDEMVDEFIKGCKTQDDLFGPQGIMKQLMKKTLERMLNAEMDYHLDDEENSDPGHTSGNSRNGKGHKTVKGDFGELEIATPR